MKDTTKVEKLALSSPSRNLALCYKTFSMLNSAEHEIYHAHIFMLKCQQIFAF